MCISSFAIYFFTPEGWSDEVRLNAGENLDRQAGDAEANDGAIASAKAKEPATEQQLMTIRETPQPTLPSAYDRGAAAIKEDFAPIPSEGDGGRPGAVDADAHKRIAEAIELGATFAEGFRSSNSHLARLTATILPSLKIGEDIRALWYIHSKDEDSGRSKQGKKRNVDTNAVVLVSGSTRSIYVTFRGTDSTANIITDLEFLKTRVGNARGTVGPRCHHGFHDAYYSMGVAKELELLLLKLTHRHTDLKEVYITGHSLGGSLANIMAWRLSKVNALPKDVKVSLFTFGAPRVGDVQFAAELDAWPQLRGHWRFVHGHDVVARVPMLNYKHAGNLVLLPGKGRVEAYADGSEAPLWTSSVLCNFNPYAHHVAAPASKAATMKDEGSADDRTPHEDQSRDARIESESDPASAHPPKVSTVKGSMAAKADDHFVGYLHAIYKITPEAWADAGPAWNGPTREQFVRAWAEKDAAGDATG